MLLLLVASFSVLISLSSGVPASHKAVDEANSLNGGHHFSPDFYIEAKSILARAKEFSNLTMEEITNLIDSIDDWEAPKEIAARFPYYLSGHDYEDRPIWIAEFGKYAVRDTIIHYPNATGIIEQVWLQAAIRIFKSMRAHQAGSENTDAKPYTYTTILDFEGLEILQIAHVPTMTFALKLFRKYLDLLTVGLHQVTIINANYATEIFISLARPVLGSFFERVEIFGGNKAKWMGFLKRTYPPDSYPPWYGGSEDWKALEIYA